jgi:hypothetical protein
MWNQEDVNTMLDLLTDGKNYKEISSVINKTESSIRSKSHKLGYKSSTYYKPKYSTFSCKECNIEFEDYTGRNRIFCSQSCNAKFNNREKGFEIREKEKESECVSCGEKINNRKYCNRECQRDYERKKIFEKIDTGDTSLYERNYKKYLINKYGEKCMDCGWCEKNRKTGNIPIQLEHIDGHSENNRLDNLKLLCPNCHSLTSTYGALNKGNGRKNRYKK